MTIYSLEKVISVGDWDSLVTEIYNRPYSFQQQDGCKERGREYINATANVAEVYDYENKKLPEIVNSNEMGVSFESWLARDPSKQLDEQKYDFELGLWWTRNFYPTVESVAHDLVKRGLLEEGKYVIDIDW